jgi:hypothetical protein
MHINRMVLWLGNLTRLTNAFSKKIENHAHAMALHFLYYNSVRIHKTLRTMPPWPRKSRRSFGRLVILDVLEAWEAASCD